MCGMLEMSGQQITTRWNDNRSLHTFLHRAGAEAQLTSSISTAVCPPPPVEADRLRAHHRERPRWREPGEEAHRPPGGDRV